MKNTLFLALVLGLSGISAFAQNSPPAESTEEFGGKEGCFLFHDLESGEESREGALCDTAVSPCSTFKIPNLIIGLDSGVIKPTHMFTWDGTNRARTAWNREMDLAMAMKASCLPCFQEVARAIGPQRMASYLGRFEYGNQNISGGIDSFWLGSSLLISPAQQIDFLVKLYTSALPVSPESQAVARRLIGQRKAKDWSWAGKTGSCQVEGAKAHGWFVGEVENKEKKAVFATLLRGEGADGPSARKATLALLQKKGWIPAGNPDQKKAGKKGMKHRPKGKPAPPAGNQPADEGQE